MSETNFDEKDKLITSSKRKIRRLLILEILVGAGLIIAIMYYINLYYS